MSKNYNICWAAPEDVTDMELPFFQTCMKGVFNAASAENYDTLLCMVSEENMSHLERIISNRKVDGIILGRTLLTDDCVELLKKSGIPFVVIGSVNTEGVVQIDNDHFSGCKELTTSLIEKGVKKFALIGGGSNHIVNLTRYAGFEAALKMNHIEIDDDMILMDNMNYYDVEKAVDVAVQAGAECLMCMDDWICNAALIKLRKSKIDVPEQIKVASFYNSQLLKEHLISVTAIQYSPSDLGSTAARTLFEMINGNPVGNKVMLGYEILMQDSTK